MKRENLAFLAAGIAFGILIGLAIDQFRQTPAPESAAPAVAAPAGPAAPTQVAGGAPMLGEVQALQARIRENPEDVEALARLANLFHDIQSWDQAKPLYERAIALRPDDADLITDYGICFVGTGDFDRALALFEQAQEARPGHPQSLFNVAIVAGLYQRDFDRAAEAIAKLESIDPRMPRLAELKAQIEQARDQAAAGS